ncbi:MAG: ion channel [Spirochaetales bacterium]|nr:ion channel [Spirochaetales bacterium]MDY5916414.1 ion channel [Treponema sp.]
MGEKNHKKKNNFFSRLFELLTSKLVIASLITILVFTGLMLIIFLSEQKTNSAINTLFDAIWYTLVTITTVGYGDITPRSVLGRTSAMILLLAGVALFGALSGKFASFLFDRQQKKDRGLLKMNKIKNHFLICGWKPNFERILEGILLANPEIPPEKIILLNNSSQNEMEKIKADSRFKNINYIHGDFTDEDTLLKSQIKTAERTLILADNSENFSSLETDSRTVLAVITIKNLNPKIYCVAEIIDSKFEKHLSLAHCDEIILSADYGQNLLIQASSGKGMSHILRELISEESDSGILICDIPQKFVGNNYGEFRLSLKTSDILIGLLENTGNFYSRRKEALAEAQKNPNVEEVVSNLKKVKSLQSNLPVFAPKDDYIIPKNAKAIFIHGNSF